MEIVSTRLEAINEISRPLTLTIATRPGEPSVLGRHHFFNGEDTIISRRHARFTISTSGTEQLQVTNLSGINGILVNFEPLPLNLTATLYDGDEIVLT
jgi:hypothetical protein